MIDRYLGAHFFDTQAGGSAILWMHFFWIFGHPEVYILVLPAFGFISEMIPSVFAQGRFLDIQAMVAASVPDWIHQPLACGRTICLQWVWGRQGNTFFVFFADDDDSSVPTGIKAIFNWLATLWGGKILFKMPMLFSIAFLFQFLIAGLTGIMLSAAALQLASWRALHILLLRTFTM